MPRPRPSCGGRSHRVRELAQLYERAKNDPHKAQQHRVKADELLAQVKQGGEDSQETTATGE